MIIHVWASRLNMKCIHRYEEFRRQYVLKGPFRERRRVSFRYACKLKAVAGFDSMVAETSATVKFPIIRADKSSMGTSSPERTMIGRADIEGEVLQWLTAAEQRVVRATWRCRGAVGCSQFVEVNSEERLAQYAVLAPRFDRLSAVSFSHLNITDLGALVDAAPWTAIRALTLKMCPRLESLAVGRAVAALGRTLECLYVRECALVGDSAVLAVDHCDKLRDFRFKACPLSVGLTDAALFALAHRPHLTVVDIDSCTGVTDASMFKLAQDALELRKFAARGTCSSITEAGLLALAESTELVECSLVSPSDRVINTVAGSRLRRLSLAGATIGDNTLGLVGRQSPRLLQFKLYAFMDDRYPKITTDAGVVSLARGCGQSLESINLDDLGAKAAIECASLLPNVRSVKLFGRCEITNAVLAAFASRCPRLRHLTAWAPSGRGSLTWEGVLHLRAASYLSTLCIGGPRVALDSRTKPLLDAAIGSVVLACRRLVALSVCASDWRTTTTSPPDKEPIERPRILRYTLPNSSCDRRAFRDGAAAIVAAGSALPHASLDAWSQLWRQHILEP